MRVIAWLAAAVGMSMAFAATPTVQVAVNRLVPENIRSSARLYQAACLAEAGVFDAADALVREYRRGSLAGLPPLARQRVAALADETGWLPAAQRDRLLGLVTARSQLEFESSAHSPEEQFDRFARQIARGDAKLTRVAARDLGITLSHRGYGAAQYAAGSLARQIETILAALGTPELRQSFGAASQWEEVAARLGGKPKADVLRLARRGQAALALAQTLEKSSVLIAAPDAARELTDQLNDARPAADAWLKNAPTRARPSAVIELALPCLDASRRLTPCRVSRAAR